MADSDPVKARYAVGPYFAMLAARYVAALLLITYMFTTARWVGIAACTASGVALTLYILLKDKSEWGDERTYAIVAHALLAALGAIAAIHAMRS